MTTMQKKNIISSMKLPMSETRAFPDIFPDNTDVYSYVR